MITVDKKPKMFPEVNDHRGTINPPNLCFHMKSLVNRVGQQMMKMRKVVYGCALGADEVEAVDHIVIMLGLLGAEYFLFLGSEII